MHLIVDGYGCDPSKLADPMVVLNFLDHTPAEIGMVKMMPPIVFPYQSPTPEQSGLSGFVIIAESHLAIHTWPERGAVWADVFSCKSFDAEKVQQVLMDAFDITRMEVDVLPRGLEIEDSLEPAFRVGGAA